MNAERGQLLRDRVRLVDGTLYWVGSGKPVTLRDDGEGYLKFCIRPIGGRTTHFFAHRAIWFLHYGAWPKHTIDHINRKRFDNRIENLRDVPLAVNCRNRRFPARRVGTGTGVRPVNGVRGVRWRADISLNKRNVYLGTFSTRELALGARHAAEQLYCVDPLPRRSGHGSESRARSTLQHGELA